MTALPRLPIIRTMEGLLRPQDVAERLGVSADTVARWCREGRIPAVRDGRGWLVPEEAAEDLAAGVPARRWTGELEAALRALARPAHVLVLVQGRADAARRFAEVCSRLDLRGAPLVLPEPPPAPAGGVFVGTALVAAARAAAAAELELVRAASGAVVRWVARLPSEAGGIEDAVDRLTRSRCLLTLCLLPRVGGGAADAPAGPHTHVLHAQIHGRSRLEPLRPLALAARMGGA